MTQRDLAATLGVSPALVALVETGDRRPTRELAERWAHALGMPLGHVFPDVFPECVEPVAAGSIAVPTVAEPANGP